MHTTVSESSTSKGTASVSPTSSDASSHVRASVLNLNKNASPLSKTRSIPSKAKRRLQCVNGETFQRTVNQMNKSIKLEDQIYFHGELPRDETVNLLKHEGEFLVRETTKDGKQETVLSVFWHTHQHFVISYKEEPDTNKQNLPTKRYYLGTASKSYGSIPELIIEYFKHRKQIPSKLKVLLLFPRPREYWEIRMKDIHFENQIGKGNFGKVFAGTLRKRCQDTQKMTHSKVAIKKCSGNITKSKRLEFLQEAQTLRQYDHPNIVKFIGICPDLGLMILMEYVDGGSLHKYLIDKNNRIKLAQRTSFCVDIANGMKYLETKNSIHMDLAARNCLIAHNSRKKMVVKIADFGMSQRGVQEYKISPNQKVSIRWSAPESIINGTFSGKTDVWSYGVVVWEIFSNAAVPFGALNMDEARDAISRYQTLQPPPDCPRDISKAMKMCWTTKPESRPSFAILHEETLNIHKKLELGSANPSHSKSSSLMGILLGGNNKVPLLEQRGSGSRT